MPRLYSEDLRWLAICMEAFFRVQCYGKKWDVRWVVFVVGSVHLKQKKNNPNTCILIATLMNSKVL